MINWNKTSKVGYPKKENIYLVYTFDGCQYVASFRFENHRLGIFPKWIIMCKCRFPEEDDFKDDDVKYWMDLPKEPEEYND